MTGTAPLQVANGILQAVNNHDIDSVAGYYSDRFVGRDVAMRGAQLGKQGVRDVVAWYYQAFPDLEIRHDQVICQGERVVVVWTASGTHGGPIMRIPASGKRIEVRG